MRTGWIVIPHTGLFPDRLDASTSFPITHGWAVVLSVRSLSVWNSRTPLRLFPLHEVHRPVASLFVWISRTPLRSHQISAICLYLTIAYGRVRDLSAFSAGVLQFAAFFPACLRSPISRFSDLGTLRSSLALFLAHALAPPPLTPPTAPSTAYQHPPSKYM
ncbi:unnamed protein product [Ectocarpus sp. 12 AP-2014]